MYQLVPNNDIYNLFIADFQDVENRYHLRWVLDAKKRFILISIGNIKVTLSD